MDISFYTASSWTVALIIFNLAFAIYIGSKDLSARAFVVLITTAALWVTSCGFFFAATSEQLALFLAKTNYFFGALTGISFLSFALTFPENTPPSRGTRLFLLILVFLMIPLHYLYDILKVLHLDTNFISQDFVINSVHRVEGLQRWVWEFGDSDFIFYIIFCSFWLAGLAMIYIKSKLLPQASLRKHSKYMFWAMVLAVSPPALFNVILPGFHTFSLFWVGVMTMPLWVAFISYTIIRFQQMNVRAIYTELLIFACILLLFISIFI
jgi:hypothetical protein